ncbi:MerR family transcriptional regulator [Streptomyces buecherae]|uniref:MerR family transcriptional regulator n=1 Tax=Streptomyces buecherae TaxID=2763006 RepID=UPI0027E34F03|nr:MerR family transcriptional regulator [Streptomyces buecherae]
MVKETEMRIGELAQRTGVTPRALRYYEQQGLLAPERAANGYREYGALDGVRAANIRELLSAGLTVEDIRPALEQGCLDVPLRERAGCADALRTATDRLAALDERIAALHGLRNRLAHHIDEVRSTAEPPRPTALTAGSVRSVRVGEARQAVPVSEGRP